MEPVEAKFDVPVPLMMTFVAVTGIALLVTVIGVDAWYKNTESEIVAEKWDQNPNVWLKNMREEQKANLSINHAIVRGHRHVPVSEAMRILALPENNGKAPK